MALSHFSGFKTMLFFDLETTGLKGFARITEIGFHAVDKIEFLNYAKDNKEPRIIRQLNLPVNPSIDLKLWEFGAQKVSGITPELMENVCDLKSSIPCIISFVQTLPKPICLIAHNGKSYDFRILKAEILRVMHGDLYTIFPACTIWADSMQIIRTIEDTTLSKIKLRIKELKENSPLNEFNKDLLEILDANDSQFNTPPREKNGNAMEGVKTDEKILEYQASSDRGDSIARLAKSNSGAKRKLFPTTDKTQPGDLQVNNKHTNVCKPQNPEDMPNLLSQFMLSNKTTCNAFRKRFAIEGANNLIDCIRTTKNSFSLRNLYMDLFGESPPGHHGAMADVTATFKVCLQYGQNFVETTERMAETLEKTE